MRWQLKPKPDLEALEEYVETNGLDRNDFPVLNSQPKLFPDLMWVWEGFQRLSGGRQRGMSSCQPLSLSEINAYCEFREIYSTEDREEFLHFVQFLDNIFVTEIDKRSAPKKK